MEGAFGLGMFLFSTPMGTLADRSALAHWLCRDQPGTGSGEYPAVVHPDALH